MSVVLIEQLKTQLSELDFDFLVGGIESFLHEESRQERPLLETLTSLFDCEITQRRQRAAKMRLKLARLPEIKRLEDFNTEYLEGISRKKLDELAMLTFVKRKENIVFMGPSGLGKSHLLIGLCHKACLEGNTAYFLTCSELIEQLVKAKHNMRLKRKLATLCKPHVLGIDEVGYQKLTQDEANLFFQLVATRYEKGSIIISTNKSFGQWSELMGEQAIATATLDRLLHHSHVIILKGESYRLKDRIKLGLVPQHI